MDSDLEGTGMTYLAVGLAVLGAAAGLAFRWKVLLPLIVLLPFAALIFSVSRGSTLEDAVIIVLVAETILQGGYFIGLLIRSVAGAGMRSVRASGFFRSRCAPKKHDSARPVPPAEAGNES